MRIGADDAGNQTLASTGSLYSDLLIVSHPGSGAGSESDDGPLFGSSPDFDANAAPRRRHILIVEDNSADVFLIRESLQSAHVDADLYVVNDGEQAIRIFERVDKDSSALCPDLVLLDLNLPKRPGREVLQAIRGTQRCANTPVLVVTSSNAERDREEMAKLQVNAYFRKPSEYREFMKVGELVKKILSERPEPPPVP